MGQSYGNGYTIDKKHEWLQQLAAAEKALYGFGAIGIGMMLRKANKWMASF